MQRWNLPGINRWLDARGMLLWSKKKMKEKPFSTYASGCVILIKYYFYAWQLFQRYNTIIILCSKTFSGKVRGDTALKMAACDFNIFMHLLEISADEERTPTNGRGRRKRSFLPNVGYGLVGYGPVGYKRRIWPRWIQALSDMAPSDTAPLDTVPISMDMKSHSQQTSVRWECRKSPQMKKEDQLTDAGRRKRSFLPLPPFLLSPFAVVI